MSYPGHVWLTCLFCGYVMDANPSSTYHRQCTKCGSLDLVADQFIDEIAVQAEKLIETTFFGITPFLDIMAAILQSRGLKLRPVSTLKLANLVYQRLQERAVEKARIKLASDISVKGGRGLPRARKRGAGPSGGTRGGEKVSREATASIEDARRKQGPDLI